MPIEEIARVIQLSIAPVFLITGIAGLLGVLSAEPRSRRWAQRSGGILRELALRIPRRLRGSGSGLAPFPA